MKRREDGGAGAGPSKRARRAARETATSGGVPLGQSQWRLPSLRGVTFDRALRRWGRAPAIEMPPEVWSSVFVRLQDHPRALASASLVCRAWRVLALGELRRWGIAPGQHADECMGQRLRFLREHCPRVAVLDVRSESFDVAQLEAVAEALPRLHSVRLIVPLSMLERLQRSHLAWANGADTGDGDGYDGGDEAADDARRRRGRSAEDDARKDRKAPRKKRATKQMMMKLADAIPWGRESRTKAVVRGMPACIRSVELTFASISSVPHALLVPLWRFLPERLDALVLNGLRSEPTRLGEALAGRSLRKLHLNHCACVDDNLLPELPRTITNLSLRGSQVTNVGVRSLGTFFPHLKKLDLSRCLKVTSAALKTLPHELESLTLICCGMIKSGDLGSLPPGLRKLNFWGCSVDITNADIGALPSTLRELTLSFSQVDDAGLAGLPQSLRHLVMHHGRVTLKGLEENLPAGVCSVNLASSLALDKELKAYPRVSRMLTNLPLPFLVSPY